MIEKLWAQFEPYADPDFEKKIKLKGEYLGRCWEMFLACTLIERGYKLQHKNGSKGPDIKIISNPDIWVEAVSCTSGTGDDAVPDLSYGVAMNVPVDEMVLRVGNAITSKFEKYKKYLEKGIVKATEPFIIGVSKGAMMHPEMHPSPMLRYLYGIGDQTLYFSIDPNTGKRNGEEEFSFSKQKPIPKKKGQEVPVAFFENPDHAGVSAVIYCQNHILNHPKPFGSDFVVFKNPNASNPIPDNFLSVGAEWIIEEDHLVYKERNFISYADIFDYLEE
jgi:hypothetical protein